ncbi:hypothetical protein MC378_12460 [Polaribacter sp. MSW13]|uniref:Uncharacterized protein n=1 Tax=Polaribacter marinus TaxID=2916838 RepID=A0A9X1VPF0_9FLAO|nr:hypothetical protein [Polaribacter marinus]MCI2229982.1 hypothetical protein [Polaribacter marinus]
MKVLLITLSLFGMLCLSKTQNTQEGNQVNTELTIGGSFKLINDTKQKVSIYTGSGFVSLNKGSKTSISCNTGKEVCWANKGKKGKVIFKITSKHCGKTIKLSTVID